MTSRFANLNSKVELLRADSVFSAEELDGLRVLASRLALDVGEMDVLRDRYDGMLYVVDVSKTVFGPPNGLDAGAGRRAVHDLTAAFRASFMP